MARRLGALAGCALTALLLLLSSARAARIWFEYGVATATAGYDADQDRTLMNKFYVAAFGPEDVRTEVPDFDRFCIQKSTIAAVHAFQSTPGEVGAKLSAAHGGFHDTLRGCLTADNLAKAYLGRFEVGYIRRGYWEPGLNVRFSAENPLTRYYVELHNAVKDKVPDPVNKLIVFYVHSEPAPNMDFKLDPPPELGKFLSLYPDPSELRRLCERADEEASKQGRRIAGEVKREAETTTRTLGSEAEDAGQEMTVAAVAVVGDAARGAKEVAPRLEEALAPAR
jgi:hypothetical protein